MIFLIILLVFSILQVNGSCPQNDPIAPEKLVQKTYQAYNCPSGYPDHCVKTSCGCVDPTLDNTKAMHLKPQIVYNGKGGSLMKPEITWLNNCTAQPRCEKGKAISIMYDSWNKTVLYFEPTFTHTNDRFYCVNGFWDLQDHPYRMIYWSCEI